MLHELTQFVARHWALVSAFVIVLILLFLEEAEAQIGGANQLSVTEATHLMNHEKAVVIDLRDADAFKRGHIIGAKHFYEADLEKHQEKIEKHRKKTIILVDANGAKAARIAARLKKENYENVRVLKGGMSAWAGADMPIVKK